MNTELQNQIEEKINWAIAELESDNHYLAETQEKELEKWNRGEF